MKQWQQEQQQDKEPPDATQSRDAVRSTSARRTSPEDRARRFPMPKFNDAGEGNGEYWSFSYYRNGDSADPGDKKALPLAMESEQQKLHSEISTSSLPMLDEPALSPPPPEAELSQYEQRRWSESTPAVVSSPAVTPASRTRKRPSKKRASRSRHQRRTVSSPNFSATDDIGQQERHLESQVSNGGHISNGRAKENATGDEQQFLQLISQVT